MESNKLMSLNNHLFEQLERLNDDELTDEGLQKEVIRGKSMTDVASKIIDNATLALEAEKIKAEYTGNPSLPKMIE